MSSRISPSLNKQINEALKAKELEGQLGVKKFIDGTVEVFQYQMMVNTCREIPVKQMTPKQAIEFALLLIKSAQS